MVMHISNDDDDGDDNDDEWNITKENVIMTFGH